MNDLVCIVKILDEVNCQLVGLSPKVRRLCVNKLSYTVPNSYFMRQKRLSGWDGKSSFMTIGGGLPIKLFPQVYEIIANEGYDFVVEDHRIPNNIEFTDVDANYLSDKTWPKGHRLEGQPIILEEHQVNTINAMLKSKQCLVASSTGSGKTITCCVLSKKVEEYGRSIIIVPSKDLVIQTEEDYRNLGLDVGVFYGKRKELDKKHTICTWQSLDRLNEKSKNELSEIEISEFLKDVVMFTVDEAHLSSSKALQKLMSGPFANTPIRWGMTGTIPKEDHLRMAIESMIGDVVYKVSAVELQEKGFLSNCDVSVEQYIDHTEHKEWPEESDYLANDPGLLQKTADRIIELSKTGNTFVLTPRHANCEKLQALIPGSVYFHGGKKDKGERQAAYNDMGDSDNKVIICTFGIASTGLNLPRIFNLVLLHPGKSFVRIIQSIGRGLRKAHDKDHVDIFIITTTNKWSAKHLTKIKSYLKEAEYPFTVKKIK